MQAASHSPLPADRAQADRQFSQRIGYVKHVIGRLCWAHNVRDDDLADNALCWAWQRFLEAIVDTVEASRGILKGLPTFGGDEYDMTKRAPFSVSAMPALSVVLGEGDAPNLFIERQPGRWVVFVHEDDTDPIGQLVARDGHSVAWEPDDGRRPYVLVEVSGGVAEVTAGEDVEVELIDYDNEPDAIPQGPAR